MPKPRIGSSATSLALVIATALATFTAGCGMSGHSAQRSLETRTGSARPAAAAAPDRNAPRRRPQATNVYAHARSQLSAKVTGVRERVYVPNSLDATVDVIDPHTFRVVSHYRVGGLPQHVTPGWDLRHLYVDDTLGNALTEIDPRSGRPVRTIPVADPYNLYFTPDGKRALVVAERHASLDVRDPHSWRLIRRLHVPGRGPDHLDFTRGGKLLLLSDEFSGDLVEVDVARLRVLARLHVGGQPIDVKLAADGSVFYVANQKLNGVTVVALRPLRRIGFIRTGRGAHGLCVSRDARRLYVANRLGGSISVVDFGTRRVVATWHVGGSPDMLQTSPDGRRLWTSNRYSRSVSVIDTRTGHVIHTIAVGNSPHGLSYFPQPGRFSLGHNGVYR